MAAWTEIEKLVAPSAGIFDFQGLDLSIYTSVQIIGSAITVTTDQTQLKLNFYKGLAVAIADYAYFMFIMTDGGTFVEESDAAQAEIPLCFADTATYKVGNAAGKSLSFSLLLGHPTLAAKHKHCTFTGAFLNSAGVSCRVEAGAMVKDTAAINGLRIAGTSNLVAGSVTLLGLGTS